MDEARRSEAGFTLVEALTAIVVLSLGIMAVANLFLVATTSNSVAGMGSASTGIASEVMDALKAQDYTTLLGAVGGNLVADAGATLRPCESYSVAANPGVYNCDSDVAGVGRIHARWQISTDNAAPGNQDVLFVQVQAEATGALGPARTRASFTMFRTCSDGSVGCP